MKKEELIAMLQKEEAENIKTMIKEKMLDIIMQEGLDQYIDFKFNDDYTLPGSVRLNKQPDGSFLLYTVGDRGVEREQTFQNEQEAYYKTVCLLREKLHLIKKISGPDYSRGMHQ